MSRVQIESIILFGYSSIIILHDVRNKESVNLNVQVLHCEHTYRVLIHCFLTVET